MNDSGQSMQPQARLNLVSTDSLQPTEHLTVVDCKGEQVVSEFSYSRKETKQTQSPSRRNKNKPVSKTSSPMKIKRRDTTKQSAQDNQEPVIVDDLEMFKTHNTSLLASETGTIKGSVGGDTIT